MKNNIFKFQGSYYDFTSKAWREYPTMLVKVGYTRHGNLKMHQYYSKEDSEWYPFNPLYVFNNKGECTSHPLSYRAINKGAKERHHRLEAI